MSAACALAVCLSALGATASVGLPGPPPATAPAPGTAAIPVPPAPPPPVPASPPATATIVPERPGLVLGAEQRVALTIEIHGADASGLRVERAVASVGAIQDVTVAGPDRLRAWYLAPATRYPQVAILVVDLIQSPGGQRVRASARLPLSAATEIPFRTSPAAGVTMRIADRQFGPIRADADGRVAIPVVVPPGVREGVARAVDRYGNTRETAVDLQPAPWRRVLVVAAAEAEAGSFVEIAVFAVDARGEPLGPGQVALTASGGLVHPLGPGAPGEERFLLETPRRVAAGPVALVATTVGTPTPTPTPTGTGTGTADKRAGELVARGEAAITLLPGAAYKLIMGAPSEPLVIGDGASATVTVAARDRLDNATSCRGATVTIDGAPAALELLPRGDGVVRVVAPARFNGKREIEIAASLGAARASARVRLVAGPAVSLSVTFAASRLVADGSNSVDVRVESRDRHGSPADAGILRWHAPGGHVAGVRMVAEGTYQAHFTPSRAREPHAETLVVGGDPPLTATTTLAVEPPLVHAVVTARVGLFSNFGSSAGPAASLEVLGGIPGHAAWGAGVVVSYLRNDLTTGYAPAVLATARLELDQFPIMAVARYHLPLPLAADVTVGAGAGISLARVEITSPPGNEAATTDANARAVALEGGADVAFPLAPGELIVGLHYLWVEIGRTSHGDQITGNSAGLIGDVGFRMAW
jgi:hypothetical protein